SKRSPGSAATQTAGNSVQTMARNGFMATRFLKYRPCLRFAPRVSPAGAKRKWALALPSRHLPASQCLIAQMRRGGGTDAGFGGAVWLLAAADAVDPVGD